MGNVNKIEIEREKLANLFLGEIISFAENGKEILSGPVDFCYIIAKTLIPDDDVQLKAFPKDWEIDIFISNEYVGSKGVRQFDLFQRAIRKAIKWYADRSKFQEVVNIYRSRYAELNQQNKALLDAMDDKNAEIARLNGIIKSHENDTDNENGFSNFDVR